MASSFFKAMPTVTVGLSLEHRARKCEIPNDHLLEQDSYAAQRDEGSDGRLREITRSEKVE